MRTMLSILLGLLLVLPCGAATIQWYSDQTAATSIRTNDVIAVERVTPHGYVSVTMDVLKNSLAGSATNVSQNFYINSNYVTIQFVTNNYVSNEFVNNSYTTNLNVVNEYTSYSTNLYSYITNLYVTQEYVDYFTNNYSYITNLIVNNITNNTFVTTNVYVQNSIEVASNVYITNIITAKTAYITNLTVISNLTANMDGLTNTAGYSGAAMADTNWVLLQLESFGSINYFGGPTNSYAITNSGETVSRTNVFTTSLVPFTTASTSTVNTLVVGAYARHAVTTNKVAAINSGLVEITTYPFRTGGGGTVSGHYEFYAVDSVSNIAYELASSPTITIAATAPQQVVVSMTLTNDFLATNGAYAMIAFMVDSAGVGGPTLSWAHGGIYSAHLSFPRPLSSATIQASQIAGTITNTVATPGSVTATLYQTYTNSWAGPTNTLDLSKGWVKYAASTPCAVTGVTGKQAAGTAVQHTLLTITNAEATNITLYYTGPVRTGDGERDWIITNATEAKLAVEYDPNNSTNAVFRLFY